MHCGVGRGSAHESFQVKTGLPPPGGGVSCTTPLVNHGLTSTATSGWLCVCVRCGETWQANAGLRSAAPGVRLAAMQLLGEALAPAAPTSGAGASPLPTQLLPRATGVSLWAFCQALLPIASGSDAGGGVAAGMGGAPGHGEVQAAAVSHVGRMLEGCHSSCDSRAWRQVAQAVLQAGTSPSPEVCCEACAAWDLGRVGMHRGGVIRGRGVHTPVAAACWPQDGHGAYRVGSLAVASMHLPLRAAPGSCERAAVRVCHTRAGRAAGHPCAVPSPQPHTRSTTRAPTPEGQASMPYASPNRPAPPLQVRQAAEDVARRQRGRPGWYAAVHHLQVGSVGWLGRVRQGMGWGGGTSCLMPGLVRVRCSLGVGRLGRV